MLEHLLTEIRMFPGGYLALLIAIIAICAASYLMWLEDHPKKQDH